MAKAVLRSAAASNKTVGPQPPDDLWEKIDAALKEMADYVPPRPPGAFTALEFMDRFGLTDSQTTNRLRKLALAGKVKRYGHSGRHVYYVFTDDGKPRA